MGWYAQMIVAEIARSGVPLVLEDAAIAPFAADLAGARGTYPDGMWRVAGIGEGLCRVVPPGSAVLGPTCGVGDVNAPDAVFWLHPPKGADLAGWFPLHHAVECLMVRPPVDTGSMQRLEALQQKAEDFATGARDVRNWIRRHLAGRSRLMRHAQTVTGGEDVVLDPLSTLAPMSQRDALRHAACGHLRLDRSTPLHLRVPTLGAAGALARIVVDARSVVRADVTAAGDAPCVSQIPEGRQVIETTAREGALWLDLSISANAGRIDTVSITTPAADIQALDDIPDALQKYADPLEAYAPQDELI